MTKPIEPTGPKWPEPPKKVKGPQLPEPGPLPEKLEKSKGTDAEKIGKWHELVNTALVESMLKKVSEGEKEFQPFDAVAALAPEKIAESMIKFLSQRNVAPKDRDAAMKGINEAFLHVFQPHGKISPDEFHKANELIRKLSGK